jgi:hypothetical protein
VPEGRPRDSVPVIHSLVGMVSYDRDQAGSIRWAATPPAGGGQTSTDHAPGHVRARSRHLHPGLVQGTDMPVT